MTVGAIRCFLLLVMVPLFAALAGPTIAQSPQRSGELPRRDVGTVREPAGFQRYAGSVLAGGNAAAFDEVVLVTGPLVRVPDQRDKRGNALFMPREPRRVEGRRTTLVYVIPEGRSPLEVVRGYQQLVKDGGGSVIYECSDSECGGDTRYSAASGGGSTGLMQLMFPGDDVPTNRADPVSCAVQNNARARQRFTSLQLGGEAGFVSVLSYVLGDMTGGDPCRGQGWDGRTIAIVTVLETKAREQRMELVKADSMAATMGRDGKVSVQTILFETAKADIRPESEAQLVEIVTFLKQNPTLRVAVVGHTDSVGGFDSNMDLSRRRAAAVTAALVGRGIAAARLVAVGVGMAAPMATNETDEGRTRNRRVEFVKL
jgi:outer membrane protein OmpA-like peptidoglycan-associated protein